MARRSTPNILTRNPVFRNFLAANTTSLLGSNVFDIAIPLYVLEKTHSAIDLSLVSVALHLPFFLMAPFTGYSVDHFNKRRLMFFSDLGQILCMLMLFAHDLAASQSLWPILLAVFAAKSLMQMSETIMTFQLIPSLVQPKDLGEANTWFLSCQRFVNVGGPLVAGIMLGVLGIRGCIAINIVSFAATLLLVYKTKNLNQLIDGDGHVPTHKSHSVAAVVKNFKESVGYIWHSSLFKPFIFMMFIWNLSSFLPNTPTTTYYFTKTQGFSAAHYGIIVALMGSFSMIGFLISGKFYDRFSFKTSFVGGCLFQAIFATVAVMFLKFPFALAILFASSRMASAMVSMGTFLLRQTRIPKHRVGGVNACLRMFFMSAAPVSAIIQGVLIQTVGVEVSMVIGVACLWGCYVYGRRLADKFGEQADLSQLEHPEAA